MKKLLILLTLLSFLLVPAAAMASVIYGGDAADQASADDILDIIFLIDVSGSMYDDISAIGSVAQSTIENLECPDCDVYVRATFAGINSAAPSYYDPSGVFDEGFTGPTINSVEDNGGAALDAINAAEGTWWVNDATADQDYYRAVVTIGDEGTENGYPVYQSDWNVAYDANQAAIAEGVFLFSWITNDPYGGVPELFETMAVGGLGSGGLVFGDTGGSFVDDREGTNDVTQTLQDIICTAAGGGTGGGEQPVPEPATMLLLGTGLVGLAGASRKKLFKK